MISIIIPVKNNEECIKNTLLSVKDQSSPEWECIIIDDNSTDNSYKTIEKFIEGDSRFKIKLNNRTGGNACRNIGIKYATKPFVMFLDADDILKPECIQNRQNFLLKHPNIDFIVSQTEVLSLDDSSLRGLFKPKENNIESLLLDFINHNIRWNTTGPTWNKKFLSEIGNWNEDYPRLQDVELNIRALLRNPKIAFLPRVDSIYYISPLSPTKKYNAR